jgi:protein SCO1/2
MKPRDIILTLAMSLALALSAVLALKRLGPVEGSGVEAFAHRADKAEALEELWPAPDFTFTDQRGAAVTKASLEGQVWIVNFIFTTCRTVCPLLTSKMVQLQRLLSGVDVRFVSVSVDPAHDTPAALAAYARQWAPEETRWTLLSTDALALPAVTAGFKVTAMQVDAGVDPIVHSAVFLLVDRKGVVRGAFSSEDRDDFQALARAARKLAGQPSQRGPELAADGASLYHQLSCAACHERPELAPPLGGRSGARQELATGAVAVFDEAYVRESLLVPQAKMVRGYTLQMPSYDGLLDEARLATLVDYVLRLPPVDAAPPSEDARVEVDPVCHMKVRVTEAALSAEFDGGTTYFCSEFCRDRFLAAPSAYSVEPGAAADR